MINTKKVVIICTNIAVISLKTTMETTTIFTRTSAIKRKTFIWHRNFEQDPCHYSLADSLGHLLLVQFLLSYGSKNNLSAIFNLTQDLNQAEKGQKQSKRIYINSNSTQVQLTILNTELPTPYMPAQ